MGCAAGDWQSGDNQVSFVFSWHIIEVHRIPHHTALHFQLLQVSADVTLRNFIHYHYIWLLRDQILHLASGRVNVVRPISMLHVKNQYF